MRNLSFAIILLTSSTLAGAQTQSHGTGSPAIGTLNGTLNVTNKTIYLNPSSRDDLRKCSATTEGYEGVLCPANLPTPVNGCDYIPKSNSDVTLLLGPPTLGNATVVQTFPHIIVGASRKAPETGILPLLSLDKTERGALRLVLDVKSSDGKIIARLDKDGFVVNRNNILTMKRTKSQLTVTDQFGVVVLDVTYFNSKAIQVAGRLITMNGSSNSCFGPSWAADIVVPGR